MSVKIVFIHKEGDKNVPTTYRFLLLVDMQRRIAHGQCRFNMHGLKCINSPKIRGNCSVQAGK